jgi:hypothetical protein
VMSGESQTPPIMAEPWFLSANQFVIIDQRPKNNHNRIITGIGTPSNQSKSPRPIVASLNPLLIQQREGEGYVPANQAESGSPMSGVRHRGPRLRR